MKTGLKLAAPFCLGLAGLWLGILSASALPMNGRVAAAGDGADAMGTVETVRWVCPYYGDCYWGGGYRAHGYWGGGRWGGGHWDRHWGHGHRGHGHWGHGGHGHGGRH